MTSTVAEHAAAHAFPSGFLWGTATASYQIEGGVDEGGRGESIWDRFAHTPGRILNGDTGDVAADHYHRYREDVALMGELGLNAYRFSIAWPRLQPRGSGSLSADGLDFYSRLVDTLLEAGIRPWVTLYHWDLPQALEDAGGWPVRDTALRFADYTAAVHERLADRVADWTTLNEPSCSAFLGYASGHHAPGRTEPDASVAAAHHLLLGHGIAVAAMRSARPDQRYGITLNLYPVTAISDEADDQDAARRVDGISNRLFLDPVLRGRYPDDVRADLEPIAGSGFIADDDAAVIAAPIDFLGINYYSRHVVRAARADRAGDGAHRQPAWVGASEVEKLDTGKPKTRMGWEIDPTGLGDVLRRVADEYDAPPLYITENGAAFVDEVTADGEVHDADRVAYLDAHIRAARQAIDDGVDLRGYFVWSLIDNFEWSWGFDRRFGVVHVDFNTQRRTIKDSGRWLSGVARANGIVS
jgi:beta-glucosidase